MPVNQKALLADCQRQLELLEADLKAQAATRPALDAALRAEYEAAREAKRVGDAFEIWRGEQATQAAVHWVLGTVFVRFLEDNGLIDPVLAGEGDHGRVAEAAEQAFFMANPTLHERDWLRHVFRKVKALPGGAALFDERHNPVFRWDLSPDAAKGLLRFWRRVDPATGKLVHDLADASWSTRFLGDLYQELSVAAKKKYALLQTPDFVEEFILDRTLAEALKVLPLSAVTMIDPTCGSGHFLLGAFARLLAAWEVKEPSAPRELLAQRALDQVAGVDLNPFAVAIARFRLILAALRACEVTRLERAPGFRLHVAVGDTLLHGDEPGRLALGDGGRGRYVRHAFTDEDLSTVTAILSRRYAVVAGNPPYIAPSDHVLSAAYRERYRSCHRHFTLSAPFIERFWELAQHTSDSSNSGWVGMINSNAFMKREFGSKLIQEFFPTIDLTHVLDTAGAYIPGHGTPTLILVGRQRAPISVSVRAVMGVQGEPGTPAIPAKGLVWSEIVSHVDDPGFDGTYVTVSDLPRTTFHKHPWSLSGGGASEVKSRIESSATCRLVDIASFIGRTSHTGEDGAFVFTSSSLKTRALDPYAVPLVIGEDVRDWAVIPQRACLFPYDQQSGLAWTEIPHDLQPHFWTYRATLRSRVDFGKTLEQRGLSWFEHSMFFSERFRQSEVVTFADVATHNQFALHRGGVVFKETAPAICLRTGSEFDCVAILGLLNSSSGGFWLKQVGHNKGSTVDQRGARQRTAAFEDFYQLKAFQVEPFPLPASMPRGITSRLHAVAENWMEFASVLMTGVANTPEALAELRQSAAEALGTMISLQEELDWCCYSLYRISDEELTLRQIAGEEANPPALKLGERAFEIVLARRMAAGFEDTTWFARHGSTPITEVPAHWPAEYRALVERRITRIERDRNIALIVDLPRFSGHVGYAARAN